MGYPGDLPWMKIHEFLLEVGSERNPKDLCIAVMNKISSLVPYDSGVLYLLYDCSKEYEHALKNVETGWSEAYVNYYSKIDNEKFSFNKALVGEVNWNDYKDTEYVTDFVKPQGFSCSASIKFFSSDYLLTGALALNRSGHGRFSETEVNILNVVRPHLLNLHANLFVSEMSDTNTGFADVHKILTKREAAVMNLICNGVSPSNISRKFFISRRTVDKHIENIHKKLGVSNRQEMLVKVFSSKGKMDQ